MTHEALPPGHFEPMTAMQVAGFMTKAYSLANTYACASTREHTDAARLELLEEIGRLTTAIAAQVRQAEALQRDLARAHDTANGFIQEIRMLKQEVRELKAFRAMANRHRPEFPADPDGPRDVWYWQGDHMDHLESMVHTLPIVIRAEQLRELLAAQPPKSVAYGAIAERAEQGLKAGWWAPLPLPGCTLCNYQYGHQIGCPNNPVDIALTAAQPQQSTPTAQDRLKPLPDEQIEDYRWNWLHGPSGVHPSAFVAGFRSAEIAHGIGTAK